MAAIRSLIIALVILAAGIFIIQRLGEGFLKQPGLPVEINRFSDFIADTRSLTNLLLIGIGALIVLLIIVWILRKASQPKRPVAMPALRAPAEEKEEETEEEPEETEEAPEDEEENTGKRR